MNSQDKTLALLAKVAEDNGAELVVDHEWANRGSARVQPVGRFETIVLVKFDFQSDYASFDVTPADVMPERDVDHAYDRGHLYANTAAKYQLLIDSVAAFLADRP